MCEIFTTLPPGLLKICVTRHSLVSSGPYRTTAPIPANHSWPMQAASSEGKRPSASGTRSRRSYPIGKTDASKMRDPTIVSSSNSACEATSTSCLRLITTHTISASAAAIPHAVMANA
eukprot:3167914-Prymnesium_polylepis.2